MLHHVRRSRRRLLHVGHTSAAASEVAGRDGQATENEFFIASDASPFLEYTKNAIYLEDEEMAIIRIGKKIKVRKIKDDSLVDPYVQELQMNLEQIEKGGFDHFMLKEIHEQPKAIKDTYRGRLLRNEGIIKMSGIEDNMKRFLNADRIIIVACGTSWHAGLVAEYIFEDLARVPVEVEYASEFRYRNPVITEKDVVIAISQSGETADTLAAIKLAKSKGAFVFGVCNVVGSSIARNTCWCLYACRTRNRCSFYQSIYDANYCFNLNRFAFS